MQDDEGRAPAPGATGSSEGTDTAGRSDSEPSGGAAPPGIDPAGVTAWFASEVAASTPPLRFELIAGGRSNLTFAVTDAAGKRFVLRRPPTGHLLPTAHDMRREHRVISSVGPAGVPAPAAIGYCGDPAVTGAEFYVMSYVEGHVLREAGQAAAAFDVAGRRRLGEDLVDTLAGLHALDPDSVGLGDLAKRDGYIGRQLRRWYAQYQASRDDQGGPDVADVDAVHDRLASRIPAQTCTGIVHGDYRLDNTVAGADARVAAVLDWELCTLGDTMADLGQLLVYWTEPGEPSALSHSATTDEGFPTRAQLAERYATMSGRDLAELDFYVAFAYWKLACILEGVYTRYVAGAMGDDGFDFSSYPDTIRMLASQASDAAARLAPR